jgi:hypothetical protein
VAPARQHRLQHTDVVDLVQRLVAADARHAREAHRNPARVRGLWLMLSKPISNTMLGDAKHRAKFLERGGPDDAIDALNSSSVRPL